MDNRASLLQSLATAVRKKNLVEAEIAAIIGRPALIGHTGEFIASLIFGIQLVPSATHKGIDGRFTEGSLSGKTVNIKWYGKMESMLDITPSSLPDYYLVMTGPKSPAISSRGQVRPWQISYVYLFDARWLVSALAGVKIGVATSVRGYLWNNAEIYPASHGSLISLTEEQRRLLSLFG